MRISLMLSVLSIALAWGCSATEVETRGWLGGVYGAWSVPDSRAPGAFVHQLSDDTPAFTGGLRKGDLVVEVDGVPVSDSGDLLSKVQTVEPGSPLSLRVYRFGKLLDIVVTVGREVSRRELRTNLRIGLDFDPIPDPSFNILNLLGFRWKHQYIDLSEPHWKYYKHWRQARGDVEGVDTSDEWRFTVALVNVAGYRRILTQERVDLERGAGDNALE